MVKRLVETHPHKLTLLLGQPEALIVADRDLYPSADQPSCAVRAPQTAPLHRGHRTRQISAGRLAAGDERQGADIDREPHETTLLPI